MANREYISGLYEGYYLSDNYKNEVHGAVLYIQPTAPPSSCYLFLGIVNNDLFLQIKELIKSFTKENSDNIRERFNSFRNNLPNWPEYKNISLSIGYVSIQDKSIIISFHNINNEDHITTISIGYYVDPSMEHFFGGMSVFLSPAVANLHTRIGQMVIVKTDYVTNFMRKKILGTESPLLDILRIIPNEYGRIEIRDDDHNRIVQNELRKMYHENEKRYIFISYSSKDELLIKSYLELLSKNNINYWIAPKSIPPGTDYSEVIVDAIEKSSAFLLFITDNSQASKWVPKELDTAIDFNKKIIPLLLTNVEIDKKFKFRLHDIQIHTLNDSHEKDEIINLLKKEV